MAAYGLGNLLTLLGHKVTFFMPPDLVPANASLETIQILDDKFQNNRIDLIWLFGLRTWKYFRRFSKSFRFVLYCFEPLNRIAYLRLKFRDKYHQGRSYHVRRFFELMKIEEMRFKEISCIREASQLGVITTFAPNVYKLWEKYSSKKLVVCPLPYPNFRLRRNRYGTSNSMGLLLGNMDSIHTRYGLDFFFEKVWTDANLSISNTTMPVLHVVGGGNMPVTFPLPHETSKLRWKGFVPDIEAEWEHAKYLLVPVPITDGVRSRILEAWCRGVPVIAHPAAEKGLMMMKPDINYLSAETPDEWIDQLNKVRETADLENLIVGGRNAYEKHFSINAVTSIYEDVINRALD